MATLKDQLKQLESGVHPEYVRKIRRLEQTYEERVLLDEVFLQFEVRFTLRYQSIQSVQTHRHTVIHTLMLSLIIRSLF